MKTEPLDFVLAALVLGGVLIVDVAVVALLVVPLSKRGLGAYHVLADAAVLTLGFGLTATLVARVIARLSPFSPGDYPMEHGLFVRWKLYTVLYEFGRGALLPFTPVFARPLVVKLFGARVGGNVAMAGHVNDPPLRSIGDDAILGFNSLVSPHAITSGKIILREVSIGAKATVGPNVVLMPGTDIGEGAIVTAGAVVVLGTRIPPYELWGGIPARKLKDIAPTDIRG